MMCRLYLPSMSRRSRWDETGVPTMPFGSNSSFAHSEPEAPFTTPVSINRQPLASSFSAAWFPQMILGSST
eukprot:10525109-Heterocapsa_arctica.AAC.1